ncbi:MAG: hypothetical protein DHS20C12_11710 [Pseudohongiella sp.]|nr:MAG: hypothetical protein DHS20C12_11710 [Pseudohongiella sp.]
MTKSSPWRQPYPLRLKRILQVHGLTQRDWYLGIHCGDGKPLANSTACDLLNHNHWPASLNIESVTHQTEERLREFKISELEISRAFEIDKDEPVHKRPAPSNRRQRLPKTLHDGDVVKRRTPFQQAPENEMLTLAAQKNFKMLTNPFVNDVMESKDVYLSEEQIYVKQTMFQTAKVGGFIAIVGESGAGKTTLRRDLFQRIQTSEQHIRVVLPRTVDKRKLTAGSICDAIIIDLKATPKSSLEAKARQVETLLTESRMAGNSHALFIEEAHELSLSVLKFLKRFLELGDGFTKLISVILVAQPELKTKLDEFANPSIREVARRCEIIELKPLNGNLEEYLALKFKRVGKTLPEIFEDDAFDALRERLRFVTNHSRTPVSMMYPLVVNNAVTKAMNLCAELGEPKVNAEIIKGI